MLRGRIVVHTFDRTGTVLRSRNLADGRKFGVILQTTDEFEGIIRTAAQATDHAAGVSRAGLHDCTGVDAVEDRSGRSVL